MAKLVSDTPDIPPGQIGTAPFRLVPEPDSGLADDLQFTLDVNCWIIAIASTMSWNQL